jgi:hypothetical protein
MTRTSGQLFCRNWMVGTDVDGGARPKQRDKVK